jgi:putative phage-type endonuclease
MLTCERERSTFIGGSDAAVAVGLCQWKSPVDLWLEKTGRQTPKDLSDNEAVRWGTILEPLVRDEYELQTGYDVTAGEFIESPSVPWMCANVDGFAKPTTLPKRVLEIKTAGSRQSHLWGEPGTDAVPQQYVCQVMHYMAVTGLESADLAVLVAGQRFRIYHVPRDEQLIDWLMERESAFWRCVETDTPPEDRRIGDAAKLFPESFGRVVVASLAIQQAVADLRTIDVALKQLQERRDGFIDSIQTYMQDAAELHDADGMPLATWKSFTANRIDTTALTKEEPEVAGKYRRTSSYRRFLLKGSKDE